MMFPDSSTKAHVTAIEAELARSTLALEQVRQAIVNRVDPVTTLAGAGALGDRLRSEWRRAVREGVPLGLLAIRVDDFGGYAHALGDRLADMTIRRVADAIRSALRRPGDFPARLVAAEFAIILPRTDESGALCVAERIRSAIHGLDLPHVGSPRGRVGVSIGVSSAHPSPRSTWEELDLVAAARRALVGARSAVGHDHILSRSLDNVSVPRRNTDHARQHARVLVRMPALVWAERRALSIPAQGQISVLGPGGARLDVAEPYAVGAVLSLSFALAPSHGIICRAVIRDRPAPRGVGVEFLDLHPDTRQQLSSYVSAQLQGR